MYQENKNFSLDGEQQAPDLHLRKSEEEDEDDEESEGESDSAEDMVL